MYLHILSFVCRFEFVDLEMSLKLPIENFVMGIACMIDEEIRRGIQSSCSALWKFELLPLVGVKLRLVASLTCVSFDYVSCSVNYIPPIDALTSARKHQTP